MKKILFLVMLSITIHAYSQQKTHYKFDVGEEFPGFILKDLNKEKISFEDFKGKVVYINFWFTACPPCREEIPDLNRLKERYGDKVEFIAITFDHPKKVQKFIAKKKFNFLHLAYAQSFIKYKMGIKGFPTNMIIDEEGIIRYVSTGGIQSRIIVKDGRAVSMRYEFLKKPLLKVLGITE